MISTSWTSVNLSNWERYLDVSIPGIRGADMALTTKWLSADPVYNNEDQIKKRENKFLLGQDPTAFDLWFTVNSNRILN